MIEVRPFSDFGGANHGWLDANHHFSFGGYHDVDVIRVTAIEDSEIGMVDAA